MQVTDLEDVDQMIRKTNYREGVIATGEKGASKTDQRVERRGGGKLEGEYGNERK